MSGEAVVIHREQCSRKWPLIGAGSGVLGLFLLAFAIFEAVKHGGWAVPLLLAGLIGPDLTFFTLGLAWLAHICLDRALGYGLRTREGAQR